MSDVRSTDVIGRTPRTRYDFLGDRLNVKVLLNTPALGTLVNHVTATVILFTAGPSLGIPGLAA